MEHWNRYIYKQTSPTKQSQHLYIHLTAMLSPCNDLCRKQLPSAQFSARVVLPMSQPWFLQCLIPDPLLRSFWFGSWTSGCYKPHPSWRCASYPASLPSCDVEKLMCRSPPLWFSMHSTFCILVYASASTAVWLVLRGWEGCSLLTMVVPAVDSSLHGPFATCLWPSISSLCNATTIKPCTKECWQRCTGFVATHNLFVLNNIIFIYIYVSTASSGEEERQRPHTYAARGYNCWVASCGFPKNSQHQRQPGLTRWVFLQFAHTHNQQFGQNSSNSHGRKKRSMIWTPMGLHALRLCWT